MHATLIALGSRGDVLPYAELGRGLCEAGHEVRVATMRTFAGLVTARGLDFHPLSGDAQALVRSAGAKLLPLVRAFGSLAREYARDLSAPELRETDVLIDQLPGALYGYDLAQKGGIPIFAASVIPLARTRVFPMLGFPRLPWPAYNRLTYLLAEQIVWQGFRPIVNRWRRETLGLPPTPWRGYMGQLGTARIPILNGFSAHVVSPPPDWGPHVHVTGYWFPEDRTWQPPDELRAFIEAGPPPVFVGLGSMPVRDPQKVVQTVVAALRRSGQRGIVHAGWGGLRVGDAHGHVLQIDYAPYDWLFPRMAMVVHHGGSGTTAFGLRAGVPSCVLPMLFDQFAWGRRIAALGVGPQPVPFRRLTVERLAAAIDRGVHDRQMHRRAAALGARIRRERGIANAVGIIAA